MPGVVRQAYCTGNFVTRTSSHKPSISHWSAAKEFCVSMCRRPKERRGALLEQDAPIAHVAARARSLHRQGIAVQG